MERFRVSVGASDLHDIESDDDIIDEPFNMGERETEVVDRFESDCDNRVELEPATKSILLLKKGLLSANLAAKSCLGNIVYDLPSLDNSKWSERIAQAEQVYARADSTSFCGERFIYCSDNPTRVRMLLSQGDDDELAPLPTAYQRQTVDANPSLRDVSSFYQLNRKQHKMFTRAGSRLLQTIVSDDSGSVDQMIGFLAGLPGSGKSRVIKSLQALAKAWNSQDALQTVAYQGVAAKAANGQTIHKLFQWNINTNCYTKRYSLAQKELFAPLKMLIMDEVSTTDVKLIGMIDHALRDYRLE
ncbi:hypothetical protein F442_20244 [Phytophthora nicotianae P10297]|uniref:Uncharacterized protein n=1 Tax=Phytophthora nicotianae P10297 TaxID=1317064 RepID=W2Y6V6_PHYNI|nr:hypothetical protein F442_20244 [Phytophthora nicotianae P10297]